ncbi:MAG: GspH/FimT family pseudopilin [Elusimicrobia bacterium]|nr:GspH/FimT family pseudopilin [Candidatus Liberimonas magnetica]
MTMLLIGKINNNGFTLVEVCLVGLILSVMFAIAWPKMGSFARRTQLHSAADGIAATLRYARDLSLTRNSYYRLSFDNSLKGYQLFFKSGFGGLKEDYKPFEDSLHRKRLLSQNITIEDISQQEVVFNPDGTSEDFSLSMNDAQGNKLALKYQGSTGRTMIAEQ